ncbi:hypothetical protein KFJ24_16670 [Marinobacter sediminum]|nr:hypothetical protein [Marinobacter sediminum]MCM0614124.1 hypothetical protein [Marinobacter sediminum]
MRRILAGFNWWYLRMYLKVDAAFCLTRGHGLRIIMAQIQIGQDAV